MLVILFLIEVLKGYLILTAVPESFALLASGFSLVGATIVLRRFLKHRDEKTEDKT